MAGVISNEHLTDIERAFDASVLGELFDQYLGCGHRPSEKVCEALGRVYGKTAGELEKIFEASRSSQ